MLGGLMRTPRLVSYRYGCFMMLPLLSLMLAGCGGGGETDSLLGTTTPAASATTGTVNISVTDGPGDDFVHAWVTIKAISFHPSATAAWSSSDTEWKSFTLNTPVTVDLASLNNGQLRKVFADLAVPLNRYKQMRIFLAGTYDTLLSSASSTSPVIKWNNQIEYLDSTGTSQEAPLEISQVSEGIAMPLDMALTTATQFNAVVDFDLEHDIRPVKYNKSTYFIYESSRTKLVDLSKAGAITGKLDPSKLCAPTALLSTCAYYVMVKAERLSTDGARYEDLHSTLVDPTTGQFTLYPLLAKDSNGNALTYDLVIRGRNMETQIIKAVPVSAGSTPTLNPTNLQTAALDVTVNSQEYSANLASTLAKNTAFVFEQTPAGDMPYEIRWANNDPYTGQLLNPVYLSKGVLHVGRYNAGASITFANTTPTETGGAGSFSVVQTGASPYYDYGSRVVMGAPVTGTQQLFTPGDPKLMTGLSQGTVVGKVTITDTAKYYDTASLVLENKYGVVSVLDISAQLLSSANYTMNVPAGSADASYTASLRLSRSGVKENPLILPVTGTIDLTTASTATFNITATLAAKTVPTGKITLSMTDGPGEDFSHVWVTVKSIALHENADQAWDASDASWKTVSLAAPVVVDLASLTNGSLKTLVSDSAIPVGTYRQMRLFFANTYDALPSASGSNSTGVVVNPFSLKWNNQVEYTDAQSVAQQVPLEIFSADQGFKIASNFTISSETGFQGIIDADLEHGIVPISVGSSRYFVLQPTLTHMDASQSGAISGVLDPSKLCFLGGNLPTCAYYVMAKAQRLNTAGTRYEVVHSTLVNPANGKFSLYPLPAQDSKGNALKYNVVLTGRNMESMIIKDVPVTMATTPTSSPTALQSSVPMSIVVNSSEYTADLAVTLTKPTSLLFQQTLTGDVAPYELKWVNNDFHTGALLNKPSLSKGGVHVAPYVANTALTFTKTATIEGQGNFSVRQTGATAFQTLSDATLMTAPVGSTQSFTPLNPTFITGAEQGNLIGVVTLTNPANYYDTAHLIFANESKVVATINISSLLTSVGNYSAYLPSGSTTSSVANATYYGYMRISKSGSTDNPLWIPISSSAIDMRNTNRAQFNITATLPAKTTTP